MKNIIFDMGNVLIKYDPVWFVERTGLESENDKRLLLENIFFSREWPLMDKGELEESGFESIVRKRLPERLHAAAHSLIFHWNEPIEPVKGMEELARDIKSAGMGVYILSNASVRAEDYILSIPAARYIDGYVISASVRMMKPEPGIYDLLIERYGLDAGASLFVDDVEANVRGAEAVGMKGFVFNDNAQELRRLIFT